MSQGKSSWSRAVRTAALGAILVGTLGGCDPEPSSDQQQSRGPQTPEALLRRIRAAARNEDHQALKDLIYPDPVRQEMLIDGIRNRKETGDAAYSDAAMASLLTDHLDKLEPISDQLRRRMFSETMYGRDPKLREIATRRPGDISMMEHREARILMVKTDKGQQLLWWENLTNLAGDDR